MPPQRRDTNENDVDESTGLLHHAQLAADTVPRMDPLRRTSAIRRRTFFEEFIGAKGPPQIAFLVVLIALGFGSTIGVVPAVMMDRYARLNHGYTGEKDCFDYGLGEKPQACLDGSADAQNAVAVEQMISNTLTFLTSSFVGSMSDEYGRKGIIGLGVLLWSMSPLMLVAIQLDPQMSPFWYYCAGSMTGLVSWISVSMSALSDVMPKKWRAPSFGLLLASFSAGFAVAPQLALILGHWYVSLLALANIWIGLLVVIFLFPETLAPGTAAHAHLVRQELYEGLDGVRRILWTFYRPMWELSILNRSRLFRLLSLLAFFSGLVSAGDRTLLIYYVEERLGFNDKDVAIMFLIMGVLGIIVQSVGLKFLNDAIGERYVVVVSFSLGCIHNLMYGVATHKWTILLGAAVSAFVGMSFPTISAIKSNNVEESEQGRIQGALSSIQALASASGPFIMRQIYGVTKDGALMGPGSMFIVASIFYLIAVFFAYLLPEEADSKNYNKLQMSEIGEALVAEESSSEFQSSATRDMEIGE